MLFHFAVLKMHVASKSLEQTTYIDKQVINKKNSANVEALPKGYLAIAT